MRAVRLGLVVFTLGASVGALPDRASGRGAVLRLQGSVEPVRSHPVIVPRLTGSSTGTLVIVHLAKPGTRVHRGDLLIEFDRQGKSRRRTIARPSTATWSSRSIASAVSSLPPPRTAKRS